MRRLSTWALMAIVATAACGGDDDDDSAPNGGAAAPLAGQYFGDVTIKHDEAAKSVFASAELRVAASNDVVGSTLSTKSPTATVGEVGALTGTIVPSSAATAEADLSVALPTLGTFTMKGVLSYGAATRQLAGMLIARDAQGAPIGSALVAVQQE